MQQSQKNWFSLSTVQKGLFHSSMESDLQNCKLSLATIQLNHKNQHLILNQVQQSVLHISIDIKKVVKFVHQPFSEHTFESRAESLCAPKGKEVFIHVCGCSSVHIHSNRLTGVAGFAIWNNKVVICQSSEGEGLENWAVQIKAWICLYLLLAYTRSVETTSAGEIEELHSVKLVTGIPTRIPASSRNRSSSLTSSPIEFHICSLPAATCL